MGGEGISTKSSLIIKASLRDGVGKGPFSRPRDACLRIVDVRGIIGRACAKQWGMHVQSNGLRMCKAMACTWRWLYLLQIQVHHLRIRA